MYMYVYVYFVVGGAEGKEVGVCMEGRNILSLSYWYL